MHFTAKEVKQCAHAYEIHWSYCIPHHPEAARLTGEMVILRHSYSAG